MNEKTGFKQSRPKPNKPEIEPALLTARQAAKLLAVGERTLWRWSRSGTIPQPVKIGGAVRFRRAELMAWLDDGCPSQRIVD